MKKLICVLLTILIICGSSFVISFASDDYTFEHFLVILNVEYSENTEASIASFRCDYVKSIEIISDPADAVYEDYQAILLVKVKNADKESFEKAFSYFEGNEKVYYVTPEYYLTSPAPESENEILKKSFLLPYDVNGDGAVSASDARTALRASVGLEELSISALRAAGVSEGESISAAHARKILRASVGLEEIPEFIINAKVGEEFGIGALYCLGAAGYYWECTGDTDSFTVREESYGADTLNIGGAVRYYYLFTPEQAGEYTLTLSYKDIKVPETVNEFTIKINAKS